LAGDLVADSQLAATATTANGGAVISFVNASGVRNPGFNSPNATYPHNVTYQEAFTVRPFGNNHVLQHPAQAYRVCVDNFLAAGKNNFTTFLKGTAQTAGPQDIDALVAFMKENYSTPNKPFDPADPTLGIPRITKVN
jgi:2',3'-cyclic-nucleotide 2'-phosphodiesterase (5'-nucleotidase family)